VDLPPHDIVLPGCRTGLKSFEARLILFTLLRFHNP